MARAALPTVCELAGDLEALTRDVRDRRIACESDRGAEIVALAMAADEHDAS